MQAALSFIGFSRLLPRQWRRVFNAALVPVFLSVVGAVSADPAADLSEVLADIETYQAEFTQTIRDQHGKLVQQSTGNMSAARPGRLRWETEQPFAQLIVVDGQQIWRYEEDLEQVIVSAYDDNLGDTPALLLSGDVASIAANYRVVRSGPFYTLLPKGEESLFRAMQVTLKAGEVTRIQLNDSLGQTTVLQFKAIVVNPSLDDASFSFEPPAGVDVLRDE